MQWAATAHLVKPILTKKELANLLALGPSRKSGSGIFKDIYELRPAQYLVYKKGHIKIKRYWKLKSKKCNDTFDEAKDKVYNLVTSSIKRQMVSDTKIATLLSGGLDSSIISAICAINSKDKLTTYSIIEPTINPPKNKLLKFLGQPLSPIIIVIAPNPYIAQKGPYRKLCLLSRTPFDNIPNKVSVINPAMLYIVKYAIIV